MTSRKSTRANRTPKPKISMRNKIILQRKCACGQLTPGLAECTSCGREKLSHSLQAKFQIAAPNDRYEREADQVAKQVMHMKAPNPGDPGSERKSEAKVQKKVQRKISRTQGGSDHHPPAISNLTGSNGQGLNLPTRRFMEPRFGHDFSAVRIHTGDRAAKSAQAVHSRAFTLGQNIVFGHGEYAPESGPGRQLLAHELTHTIQQGSGTQRLQRVVQVQPNATAVNDILGQFNELCGGGNFTIGTNNQIESNCTQNSPGCDCLCDVTTDPDRAYTIQVHNVSNSPRSETLHDGTTETIPMPSQGPNTYNGDHPIINMASTSGSSMAFGAFLSNGAPFMFTNSRILAHELCGHGRLRQTYSGSKGNRPAHDATITTGNTIGGSPIRGLFSSTRQGESFHQLPNSSAKKVFKLVDGWHHEHVP